MTTDRLGAPLAVGDHIALAGGCGCTGVVLRIMDGQLVVALYPYGERTLTDPERVTRLEEGATL